MASEITEKKREIADALTEMQKDYRKKRKQVAEQQSEDLNTLQESYGKQKQELSSAGEAAINHIKKINDQKLNQAKTLGD